MATLQNYKDCFKSKLAEAARIINGHITDGVPDGELISVIRALRYMNPEHLQADYNDLLTNAVYLIKYYAYAAEYAVMFNSVINREMDAKRDSEEYIRRISPVTFGCGSFNSTWSLGFDFACRKDFNPRFNYSVPEVDTGVDLARWPLTFDMSQYPGHISTVLAQTDIVSYISEHLNGDVNLLSFNKILNELPDHAVDGIVDALRRRAEEGLFSGGVYYLCISHSKSEYDGKDGVKAIAGRLADAVNVNNEFDVDDTVPECFYGNRFSSNRLAKMKVIDPQTSTKCYCFNSSANDKYLPVSCLFDGAFEVTGEVSDLINVLDEYVQAHMPGDEFRVIRTTSQIRLQVIRLTRRTGGDI